MSANISVSFYFTCPKFGPGSFDPGLFFGFFQILCLYKGVFLIYNKYLVRGQQFWW